MRARQRLVRMNSLCKVTTIIIPEVGGVNKAVHRVRPTLVGMDRREDARTVIARMLIDYGAEVGQAGSVDEALVVLAQQRPHVVVTDIAMPGRDGCDLLACIRSQAEWRASR